MLVQPFLQWKSSKCYILWVCICSLRYPARNAHGSYCYLWRAQLYNIFSTLSHKRHDFRKKKLFSIKCVFWFPLQVLSETFLILRRNERDMIKNVYMGCIENTSCSDPILMKLEFSRRICEKYSNSSSGIRVVPCEWTDWRVDRHDKSNSRLSQFCERP